MEDAGGDKMGEHVAELDGNHETEKHEVEKQKHLDMENDHAHLDPSRWWFASSAFPMIAGTLGPVASAFSVCALVRPWRQSMTGIDIANAQYTEDPRWLLAINGVQLVIAIVANCALLLNMTRRLRFTIAQPITIVGWYISSLTLLALLSTAAGPLVLEPLDPNSRWVWSQAFYYGIYAAVLYFIVASLMIITIWGSMTGHYAKDFMLTPSQRTLMLQTIMFLIYLLVGALVFSKIEGWNYLDAVYWADVTLFTVGFGDFAAVTPLGRALLFPYALIGVISLGLVIGSIRSLVLERGRRRLDARMIEKRRRTFLKHMARRGKDDILVPVKDDNDGISATSDHQGLTELERRENEFHIMRKIQRQAERRRKWMAMAVSTGVWLVLWLVGAKIFQSCELEYQNWSYFDGFYFAFVTLTTIGYGDVTPVSNAGKSFFVFWSLLALPTMTVLISNAGDTVVRVIRDATNTLGTVTIMPGEHGFRKDIKQFLRMLSCGTLFDDDENIKEDPPGFLGQSQPVEESDEDEDEDDDNNDGGTHKGGGMGVESSGRQDVRDLESATNAIQPQAKQQQAKEDQTKAGNKSGSSRNESPPAKQPAERESEDASSETLLNEKDKEKKEMGKRQVTYHTPSPERQPNRANNSIYQSDKKGQNGASPDPSSSQLKLKRAGTMRVELPDIPADKASYHLLLIEEIGRVSQHLKHHPPRQYTYQEWAWYLKLMGEDESSSETHRKARPHVHSKQNNQSSHPHHHRNPHHGNHHHHQHPEDAGGAHDGGNSPSASNEQHHDNERKPPEGETKAKEGGETPQWSWVGSRSPLMGSQEEAEWILEKLTQKLTEELRETATSERKLQHSHKHHSSQQLRQHDDAPQEATSPESPSGSKSDAESPAVGGS